MREKIMLLVAKLLGVKIKVGRMYSGHLAYIGPPQDSHEKLEKGNGTIK